MNILLYNPLSRNGSKPKYINKIVGKISKSGHEIIAHNLLDIFDVDGFIKSLHEDDKIIILGGDGTINRLINTIKDKPLKQDIFMLRAGTGNDFLRSLKEKGETIKINNYLHDLPVVKNNGREHVFLNGVGLGLDGLISDLVNNSRFKKNKFNYFRHAIEGFIKFKPVAGKITIDGKEIKEDKLWLISVMNSSYFGGGMKIAPYANRLEKKLDVVLVKDIPKFLLILIFPTIYLGWHTIFKRFAKFYKGENIEIELSDDCHMQVDGEAEYPVRKLKASIK